MVNSVNIYIGSEILKRIVFVAPAAVDGDTPALWRVTKVFIGADLVFAEIPGLPLTQNLAILSEPARTAP